MECNEAVRKYEEYLLGNLSPRERESLAAHIKDCAECFLLDESNREFLPAGKFKKFVRINLEARK